MVSFLWIFSILMSEAHFRNISYVPDFISNGKWNLDKFFSIVTDHTVHNVHISRIEVCDKLVWNHTSNGLYIVKIWLSCCLWFLKHPVVSCSFTSSSNSHYNLRKLIWHISAPPKVYIFLWHLSNNVITRSLNLFNRKCAQSPIF